jgi:hypothetical protein
VEKEAGRFKTGPIAEAPKTTGLPEDQKVHPVPLLVTGPEVIPEKVIPVHIDQVVILEVAAVHIHPYEVHREADLPALEAEVVEDQALVPAEAPGLPDAVDKEIYEI